MISAGMIVILLVAVIWIIAIVLDARAIQTIIEPVGILVFLGLVILCLYRLP